jgi:hypothetical protein
MVIFYDAIVYQGYRFVTIKMRMGILFGGDAMRRPTRMSEANIAIGSKGSKLLLELIKHANRFNYFQGAGIMRYACKTSGIIAAIF